MKTAVTCFGSSLVLMLCAAPAAAQDTAMPGSDGPMEKCMKAALASKPGRTIKLEFKDERGTPTYEFNILGKDGKEWELECDGNTGKIVETEQEVPSANHALFKGKRKISEREARAAALKAQPGKVVELEFEIEENGDASYEYDILTADGTEMKLEVDAATGNIVEQGQQEFYQIGEESDARKAAK
jgi:uncharacterized membrane protein YkoI